MSAAIESKTWTEDELRAEATRRFGQNPHKWKFKCPMCDHVACAEDHPDEFKSGWQPNSECVGRYMEKDAAPKMNLGGGVEGPPCDWCAYGLFRGPHFVLMNHDPARPQPMFPLADALDRTHPGRALR